MTNTFVEGINSIEHESIGVGEIRIDDSPTELKPVGKGRGRDYDYLFALEKVIDPQAEQEKLRLMLEEHPPFKGELLVDIGACLEKDERGHLVTKLLENQRGIWRVLRSDSWFEAYTIFGGGYSIVIRTEAYERTRLAQVARAFIGLLGEAN